MYTIRPILAYAAVHMCRKERRYAGIVERVKDMVNKYELMKDIQELAKQVYELSEKYGGVYINVFRCKDGASIATTQTDEKFESAYYWKEKS